MVQEWTELYAEELTEIIVRFETVTLSWEAFQEGDTTAFEKVATGKALWSRQISMTPEPGIGTYVSQEKVWLEQVKVISYTGSLAYFEATVHREGTRHYLETGMTRAARYVSRTLYLVVREDDVWKVADFVSCPVPERDPDCEVLPSDLDY
jgi:hypothetical protein